MGKLKEFFKDKKYGFYVVLGTMLLSLVTMIVYAVGFSYLGFLSVWAIVLLVVGVVVSAALLAFKQYRFAPATLFATVFAALLLAIYYMYDYVASSLFWGNFALPPQLVSTVVFFALAFVASIVSVFTPMVKEEKNKEYAK